MNSLPSMKNLVYGLNSIARHKTHPYIKPRHASTLLIIDQSKTNGEPHIWMGKRAMHHIFMPGKYVFPGGRVERGDYKIQFDLKIGDLTNKRLLDKQNQPLSKNMPKALLLSALRETFEETGLIIGKKMNDNGIKKWYHGEDKAWRKFQQLGYIPDISKIDFMARAITPPGKPRRFDTRFFIIDAKYISDRIRDDELLNNELSCINLISFQSALKQDLPPITKVILYEIMHREQKGGIFNNSHNTSLYRFIGNNFIRSEFS